MINSPSVFERLMEKVFAGLSHHILLICLNDITVYSRTFEAHVENLQEVFDQLKEASLKLNAKKCQLVSATNVYVGYQVSAEGISIDSQKICAI